MGKKYDRKKQNTIEIKKMKRRRNTKIPNKQFSPSSMTDHIVFAYSDVY